jgi:demethylmenaquinone methyltransferase/2-methoxy-6-polyprenyl-1,4-benzoquinol methylase
MQDTSTENHKTADFGFERVAWEAKQQKVRGVFESVASRYDIMNDVMSAGMHRLWKNRFVSKIHAPANAMILDIAGGTADIALRIKKRTGLPVLVSDINHAMLKAGQARMLDIGESKKLRWLCANAEALPLADSSVDVITIAFGLRNVTDIDKALREAHRVLKPGGHFLCLEFSPIESGLMQKLYDTYSFHIIPRMGAMIAGDKASYQYLVESIRMFPNAKALEMRMQSAGFNRTRYEHLSAGVVAIHEGWRI